MKPFRRAGVILALAASTLAVPARAQLPTLGDAGDLSTAQERRIGDQVAREMYRDLDYIDDPVLAEYVQGIWQPLLDAARARGELTPELDQRFAWQVLLGKDREINAFAVPGGWLGLQLGLLNVTTSRDEVASVLAHELSHVTQRHISRMMAQESRQAPLVLVGMLLGMLAMTRNPNAGNAMVTGAQAASAQSGLNFSRDMEREADRVGYGVLTQAGYDPHAFASMFEKLQLASRHTDNGAFPYLRTHPLTTERIAEMQARSQLLPAPARGQSLEHALIAARSRVVSAPGIDDVRVLFNEAATLQATTPPPRRAAALYASALAAAKLRDFARAATVVQQLQSERGVRSDAAASRLARLLAAEVALLAGQPARAQAVLGDGAGSGTSRAELVLWAQARTAAGGANEVAQRLQSWVAMNKRDALAWQLLSAAYGAQGQQVRAVRADAEARAAQLDYAAAVDRFRAAQEMVRHGAPGTDYIEASIIDSRLRELQSLSREQALQR